MFLQKLLLLILPFSWFWGNGPVKVTVYHQKGITASGEHTDSIGIPFASISRDLLATYPMHSKVKLENCPFEGIYVIKDKMNKRIKNTIDVFLTDNSKKYNPCTCDLSVYIEEIIPIAVDSSAVSGK